MIFNIIQYNVNIICYRYSKINHYVGQNYNYLTKNSRNYLYIEYF